MTDLSIDEKFWDGHAAFQTIGHIHVCCDSAAEGHDRCDVMAVECADGRWYVEDNWEGDARGAAGVWNPFEKEGALPRFFANEDEALRHAAAVVAAVSGVTVEELLGHYITDPES